MANRIRFGGFTLLEVMLVMVLLGLAFSAVVPSLPSGDGGAAIDRESKRLLQFLLAARDQALAEGQDLGLEQTDTGYRLLMFKKDRWTVAEGQRLLAPITVNPALRLSVIAGDSIWQESLDLEKGSGFTFEDDDNKDVEVGRERDDFSDEETLSPILFFWSSGNLSPASIRVFPVNKDANGRTILIEESGAITLQDEVGSR